MESPHQDSRILGSLLPSFAPMPLLRRLAQGRLTPGHPCHEAVNGIVMFADLSGFTTLTERWGQSGPSGAERLSRHLNSILGRLVDTIVAYGGEVHRFAGDAVIAVWLEEQSTAADALVSQAATCALALQSLFALGAEQELEMHIGIGAGQLHLFQTGGVGDKWHFIAGGDPMRQAAEAERAARPGQTVLSAQAFSHGGSRVTASILDSGYFLLASASGAAQPAGPAGDKPDPSCVRPYIPATIAGRIDIASEEWLAEFRRVTSLFIGVADQWGGSPEDLQNLQSATRCIQSVLERYGGSLTQFLIDSKGLVGLAAWGVPSATHEDNADRAVAAALALQAELQALGFAAAMGITMGRVFAGVLGNDRHRQYALHGAKVNAAVRLMQAAAGDTLCDDATRRACGVAMSFQATDMSPFKGMEASDRIWRPDAVSHPTPQSGPEQTLLGRELQCQQIAAWLAGLTGNPAGGLLWLEGEPGIGKTRLLAWLGTRAAADGLEVHWTGGESLQAGAPYSAWRRLFLELYAASDATDTETLRSAVLADLANEPSQLSYAPLAGAIFPGEWPDTEVTAGLIGQVRADATRALLTHLLHRRLGDRQRILVLDDGQWLDSSSWALAQEVCAQVPQLALVLATRPLDPLENNASQTPALQLRRLADERLLLDRLDAVAVRALLQERLAVSGLDSRVVDLILERAEGNPFFTEELLLALRESGALTVQDGHCRLVAPTDAQGRILAVPETVEDVILSRIDQRPEDQQLTLRIASVIGRAFALSPLATIHPSGTTEQSLCLQLDALTEAQLTEADKPASQWLFRHAITRDVAYELLTFAQRRLLHRRAAEFYQHWQHDPSYYPLLAHHWDRGGDDSRAVEYLGLAAETAAGEGAHLEAVRYLQRLLELSGLSDVKVGDTQRIHWQRLLAQSLYALGDLKAASASAQHALSGLGFNSPHSQAGWLLAMLIQIARQLTHLALPAAAVASRRLNPALLEEGALAAQCLAECNFFASQPIKLITASNLSVNLAERIPGHKPRIARSYALLGLINGLLGLHRAGRGYFRHARQIARENADPAGLGYAHHTEAAYWCGLGDWPRASHHARKALESAQALHDPQQFGLNQSLLASAAIYTGEFEVATQRIHALHTAARQHGNRQHEAWGLYSDGQLKLRKGDLQGGIASCESAWALLQSQQDHASEAICQGTLSLAQAWSGDWQAAHQAAEKVVDCLRHSPPTAFSVSEGYLGAGLALLAVAERADDKAAADSALEQARWLIRSLSRFSRTLTLGRPALYLLRARLYDLDGKARRASRNARRAIVESEARNMPFEACLGYWQLARLSPPASGSRQEALQGVDRHAKVLGNRWLVEAASGNDVAQSRVRG